MDTLSCTLWFWLFGLASLLLGAFAYWLLSRKRMADLDAKLIVERGKVTQLESEYANLRTSTTSEILALKDENGNITEKIEHQSSPSSEVEIDLRNKYEKLQAENKSLQNQLSVAVPTESGIPKAKYEKLKTKYDNLVVDYQQVMDEVSTDLSESQDSEELEKKVKEFKSKSNKKSKKLKKLRREIEKLSKKKSNQNKTRGIKEKIEIRKSLKVGKLLDWLKDDKAYKVKKKVSTRKLRKK